MLDLDTPHHWSCAVFICALLLFVSTFYLEIQAQNITHSYNHSLAYDANASVNIDNKAAEHIYQPYQSTIYQGSLYNRAVASLRLAASVVR